MNALVKEELEHIHPLPPGSPENIFRVSYSSDRQHQLSKGIDDRVQSLLVAAKSCRDQSIKIPPFDEAYFGINREELIRSIMRKLEIEIDQSTKPPAHRVQCPMKGDELVDVHRNCVPIDLDTFDSTKVDRSLCNCCDGIDSDPTNPSIARYVRCTYPNPIYRGVRRFWSVG